MSNMKKLLQIVTESGEKARIDEGVNVSINVSGDSPCDVGEVLAKVTNLSNPRPVTPDMMPAPSAPPPMPMVKAIDIVGKADEPKGPAVPPAPPGDMEPPSAPEAIGQSVMMPDPSEEPTGGPSTSSQPGAPMGGAVMGGDEDELESLISDAEKELGIDKDQDADDDWRKDLDVDSDADLARRDYYDLKGWDRDPSSMEGEEEESMLDPSIGSAHGSVAAGGEEAEDMLEPKTKALTMNSTYKDIHDRLREIDQALKKKNEEFANQPDPKYSDTEYMTKDLAGGLNKPKAMSKHSYKQGDNPMAMETVVREEWQKFRDSE